MGMMSVITRPYLFPLPQHRFTAPLHTTAYNRITTPLSSLSTLYSSFADYN